MANKEEEKFKDISKEYFLRVLERAIKPPDQETSKISEKSNSDCCKEKILIQIILKIFRGYEMINAPNPILAVRQKPLKGIGISIPQAVNFLGMGNCSMFLAHS